MKQPKKLTRNQKTLLAKKGMDPQRYMLHSETKDRMVVFDKEEKRLVEVEK